MCKIERGISVIIPAFNEETHIRKTIEQIDKYLKTYPLYFEIIIVDDGSTDNTIKQVDGCAAKIIRNETNKGKGFSVMRGINAAKYRTIVILDADYAIDISNLYTYYEQTQRKKPFAVNAIRTFNPPYPLKRLIFHKAYLLLVNLMFNNLAQDTQAPFKILHNIDKSIFKGFRTDGFAYDVELLLCIKKAKIPIKEQAMEFRHELKSHVKTKHILSMLRALLRIRFGDENYDSKKDIQTMLDNKLLPIKLLDEFIDDIKKN